MRIVRPVPPLPAGPPARTAAAARDDKQINEITARLGRRFPPERISQTDLEGRVRRFYGQFRNARIRSFVAILVERLTRRSIEAQDPLAPGDVPTQVAGGGQGRTGVR
jgi:hypothetical protein